LKAKLHNHSANIKRLAEAAHEKRTKTPTTFCHGMANG
jgi:hypothetical protein